MIIITAVIVKRKSEYNVKGQKIEIDNNNWHLDCVLMEPAVYKKEKEKSNGHAIYSCHIDTRLLSDAIKNNELLSQSLYTQ